MSLWDDISSWLGRQGDPEAQGAAQASTAMQPAVEDWLKNVTTGRYAGDYFGNLSQGYDPNRSFAQNAQDPTLLQHAADIALGFSGGGLATKARLPAASDLPAPNIGQGSAAPLFDYSHLADVPNVPQFDLPRFAGKGPTERAQAVADPANLARVNEMAAAGIPLGGREWYNTQPLMEAFQEHLGTEQGQREYRRYLDYVAATSPRSAVPQNIRTASYYYAQPEGATGSFPPPNPYGGLAQKLWQQNLTKLQSGGEISSLTNPKPPSFGQNLQGNQQPVAVDTHNARALGYLQGGVGEEGKVTKADYGTLESIQQEQAARMGLSPAQYQASLWLGAGNETGLRSPAEPFLATLEARVRHTATVRGETPQQTFQKFITKQAPLLALPAGLLGMQAVPDNAGGVAAQ